MLVLVLVLKKGQPCLLVLQVPGGGDGVCGGGEGGHRDAGRQGGACQALKRASQALGGILLASLGGEGRRALGREYPAARVECSLHLS